MDDEKARADFPGSKPLDDGIDKNRWPWNTHGMAATYAKINHRRRMKGLFPIGTGRSRSSLRETRDQASDPDPDSP